MSARTRRQTHLRASYLGSPRYHVLDEVPVSRRVNYGHGVFLGVELEQRDVDGDSTLTLGLQLVQHPGEFEGALPHLENRKPPEHEAPSLLRAAHLRPHLRCALLKLVQPPLVDASTLVDQVTGGGGLPAVHVSDNYHINVSLLLPHHPNWVSGTGRILRWNKTTSCCSPGL